MKGRIFDIQRFSVHDGPGIRTTVFTAGCNLKCFWCHNPESIEATSRICFNEIKCIGCGMCLDVCPLRCHTNTEGYHKFHRENCTYCGRCAEVCFADALALTSREEDSEKILEKVLVDKPFYKHNGGMTVSGGEPLIQAEFTKSLLKGAKKAGIHTAVDTAGHVPFPRFETIMPYTDLFLYDLKCMDSEIHRKVTGVSNELILENLLTLSNKKVNIIIRIPVIQGVNNNIQNMSEAASFLKKLPGIEQVELLTFHGLGSSKYESLGIVYEAENLSPCTNEEMKKLTRPFKSVGLDVKIS